VGGGACVNLRAWVGDQLCLVLAGVGWGKSEDGPAKFVVGAKPEAEEGCPWEITQAERRGEVCGWVWDR